MMEYIPAKQLLSSYTSGDGWFGANYVINLYKGCNHGCIYCDSRSECYQIEDFDKVRAKKDALQILESELIKKRKKGIISNGAMSDPYTAFEKVYEITRDALKLILKYGFGASLLTKSDLILRDLDILSQIKRHSEVMVKFTITTYDDALCRLLEPHAPLSSERFKALKACSDKGIFTGILLMPILPFINDTEENIRNIVIEAAKCGADFVVPFFSVTLRQNQRFYYYRQLDRLFPGLKKKYIKTYQDAYECVSPSYANLYKVAIEECERYGLLYKMADVTRALRAQHNNQLSLFEC